MMKYLPEEPHVLLFISIAFAYNLPFTAMGSLIHYYSDKYGTSFFVYLNVAYYLTGLPTSIMQRKVDTYFDTLYGSKLTFRIRMYTSLIALVILVLLVPISDYTTLIIISFFIGIFNWLSHGSATTLASIVQKQSSTYQLIGFMFPGVVCIILVLAFNVSDADSISLEELYTYYGIVSLCSMQGICAWYVLCRSDFVLVSLMANDNKVGGLILQQDLEQRFNGKLKNNVKLKGVLRDKDVGDMQIDAHDASSHSQDTLRNPSNNSSNSNNNSNNNSRHTAIEVISPLMMGSGSGTKDRETRMESGTKDRETRMESGTSSHGVESMAIEPEDRYSYTDYNRLSMNALMRISAVKDTVKGILEAQPDIAYKTTENSVLEDKVENYRWALYILMYCSILEASFFSYVPSQPNSTLYIPSVLYFVRVFSDFSGRGIALVYQSPLFVDINRIVVCVVIRFFVMFIYFAYIMLPQQYFFRNDYFMIGYQVNLV